ncbi:nicotinate-nucleotide--dimethylbenzimidazole phosphoribosyltransferase [Pseudokordiimonas caeni]|uniref:nicotinate-nucleotide--dimethylbenzimidazole phosphoribosyltransferase n=1 Tax=Pseudokordiimonas caeni TaxID=2997908 RepID=UPI002810E643|nr:nicotinate-nucleotide--dimethylbenzimidazole phosphoribosyltransferase [Pseudokordiimonas caeni]
MQTNASPFDDLRTLIDRLPALDDCAGRHVRQHLAVKGIVTGAMPDIAEWLASVAGGEHPATRETHICLLASSYEDGADPEAITGFIAEASKGTAPVNQLCKPGGVGLRILELAPTVPHRVDVEAPTWSARDMMAAAAFGMEAVAAGGNVLGLSALAFGGEAHAATLLTVLEKAGERGDPLELARHYAGREVAALIGAILAARMQKLAVILDGAAALSAAAVLYTLSPAAISHCRLAATETAEMEKAAARMGLTPLLSQSSGAGPGADAALAAGLLAAAASLV